MKIRGIFTPAITPLRQDGEIDWIGFAAILEHLVAAGVDGVVVGGTTGEYYAHSTEERLDSLRRAKVAGAGSEPGDIRLLCRSSCGCWNNGDNGCGG